MSLHGVLVGGTLRLVSLRPAVAQVDSVGRPGVPITVRAVAPGGAVVNVTVTHAGQSLTSSVPVTVTARPAR